VIPSGHICQIFGWSSASRFQSVSTRSPTPCVGQLFGQTALDKLYDMFADIWEKFEGVSVMSAGACTMKGDDSPTITGC
jgi:hypothetical protein